MKALLITASVCLLIYVSYRTYRFVTLAKDLREKLSAGATILDVRTPNEYSRGHIEGAVNFPLGKLRQDYKFLDTGKVYITCCSHGLRSVKAVSILQERGFRKVYNGGAWVDLESSIPHK